MIATNRRKKKSASPAPAASALEHPATTPAPARTPARAAPPEQPSSAPTAERAKKNDGKAARQTAVPDAPSPDAVPEQEASLEHGRHVAFLADRLFDGLLPLHGLGKRWKRRLHLAALLHDIGFAEGRRKHHKVSMRTIEEDRALDIADKDRPLVALLARYHRKAWPSSRHRRFAALSDKKRDAIKKTAALLRVADGLDYRHLSVVQDVSVELTEASVRLWLRAGGESAPECARAVKKGDLLEHLFQKKLECLCQEEA